MRILDLDRNRFNQLKRSMTTPAKKKEVATMAMDMLNEAYTMEEPVHDRFTIRAQALYDHAIRDALAEAIYKTIEEK